MKLICKATSKHSPQHLRSTHFLLLLRVESGLTIWNNENLVSCTSPSPLPILRLNQTCGVGVRQQKTEVCDVCIFLHFFFFYGFHYHGFFSIITGLKKFLKCSSKKDINERQKVWKFTHKFYNWILLRQMSTYSGEKSKGPIIWDFTRIDGFY